MTKTLNVNYYNVISEGSGFFQTTSADTDTFNRADFSNTDYALDKHDHTTGKGLQVPYAGINAAAFTSWTPLLTQSNTPTNTNTCSYVQMGKLVCAYLTINFTSAGTAGNDITLGSLPVAPKQAGNQSLGNFHFYHSGGGVFYVGSAFSIGSSQAKFMGNGNGGGYMGGVAGPSFAIANGDYLTAVLTYEAA